MCSMTRSITDNKQGLERTVTSSKIFSILGIKQLINQFSKWAIVTQTLGSDW
jgi:hypothetical protein